MMRFSRFLVTAICLPGYAKAAKLIRAQSGEEINGKYIVVLKDDENLSRMSQEELNHKIKGTAESMIADVQGELNHVYTSALYGYAAALSETALQKILDDPRIRYIEQDGIVNATAVGSWGLDRIDDRDLPLDKSYNPSFGNGGAGVTAYVIDTGIYSKHKDFEGRATQAKNTAGGPNEDCNGHGTHVAGTIGSKTYGVAAKTKLVGVKVLDCGGSGSWSGVIAGIDWVKQDAKKQNKPATANMSLGGGKNQSINKAVKSLYQSGVSVVVAAGNSYADACRYSPASEPTAVTVGSTTRKDAKSDFSNYGGCVDIFAPGSDIKAPWIGSTTATETISGTSMASPHVCGAIALYLGKDKNLSPFKLAKELVEDSVSGTIKNVGSGSPNKFLFVGDDSANDDDGGNDDSNNDDSNNDDSSNDDAPSGNDDYDDAPYYSYDDAPSGNDDYDDAPYYSYDDAPYYSYDDAPYYSYDDAPSGNDDYDDAPYYSYDDAPSGNDDYYYSVEPTSAEPTISPTESPTSAEPTMSPTESPTQSPTDSNICEAKNKKLCAKKISLGCVFWKKSCVECSSLNVKNCKKFKTCMVNGKSCGSCADIPNKNKCIKANCTYDQKVKACMSCAAYPNKTKCKKAKCAFMTGNNGGCVACGTFTKNNCTKKGKGKGYCVWKSKKCIFSSGKSAGGDGEETESENASL